MLARAKPPRPGSAAEAALLVRTDRDCSPEVTAALLGWISCDRTRRLGSGRPVVPASGLAAFSCGGRYRVASSLVMQAAAPDRGSWEDYPAGRQEKAGMGTWGIGPFDNDTAADFAGDLDDALPGEPEALVRGVLTRTVKATGYLDEAQEAVAAAALIAAQCRAAGR